MDTRFLKASIVTLLAALITTIGSARADDTDVYMNPGSGLPPGSEPMVMFSLDYRPNLGSTACNGNECDTLIAEGYMAPTGPTAHLPPLIPGILALFWGLFGMGLAGGYAARLFTITAFLRP
jgi:hypothetical protein